MKINTQTNMTMNEQGSEQPANMIGGEIMEVMMTGGDIGDMNEETVAQVVNMLQVEGQLTSGNNTIIIRQQGSSEIQMIQTSNNCGELIVTKASEADIQALQANNGILENEKILDGQQGPVVMMDEGGNIVEGVVQMQGSGTDPSDISINQEITGDALVTTGKNDDTKSTEILDQFVDVRNINNQENVMHTANSAKPITISTTTGHQKPKLNSGLNGEVVSIKINTGLASRRKDKLPKYSPKNVIKISTVTGQQKYQPPKFHKCEACAINFVSRVAYMNHMENCPSKRKAISPISKGSVTYTCVFCDTKFTSRLVLMQHVRTCDKAKSSKNLSASSKLNVPTSESKLKPGNKTSISKVLTKNLLNDKSYKNKSKDFNLDKSSRKKSILDPDDEDDFPSKLDSDDDDENAIVYDDDEDLNDQDLNDDENIEEAVSKRSQKHLGPILVKGMFKCRDCNRTFSKEHQYNRHVKACTNAPLNSSRADANENTLNTNSTTDQSTTLSTKRKRGRPLKSFSEDNDESPTKKRALGPRIVSVNPKTLGPLRGKSKFFNLGENDSDEEADFVDDTNDKLRKLKKSRLNNNNTSSHSKVVKISPSDSLIKQTSKALLNKMNREKFLKIFKEVPFCGLCGDKFKTNEELTSHTQILHSEDLLHLRDSLDGKGNLTSLKCPLCDLHFVSSHTMLLHMVSSHDRDLKSVHDELENQNLHLVCPFCLEFSLTQDLFREHLATKHLDKLINKPSTTHHPPSIDIHSILEKRIQNNEEVISDLGNKERVPCSECGLCFFKSYFSHHKCAAETCSSSARKFVCSEEQCSHLTFFKLIHLLAHLQQAHEKTLPHESRSFECMTHFLDWLKKEETQTKMKYTKAFQRMKQGSLCTIWVCHRFHNAMKDGDVKALSKRGPTGESNKLNRCYSRIHTQTSFNMSTSRYDGTTTISYYPEHVHEAESTTKLVISSDPVVAPSPLPEADATADAPSPSTTEQIPTPSPAFSDAAELKQLLEDDQPTPSFESSSTTDDFVGSVFKEKSHVKDESTDLSSLSSIVSSDTKPDSPLDTKPSSDPGPSQERSDGKETKESSGLVTFTDTDLLLEKMLGEHENEGATPPSTVSVSGTSDALTETVVPTEAKISDVDMLEAFGGCLTPEEVSNSSASQSETADPVTTKTSDETGKADDSAKLSATEDEDDENTYVLPADVEEWSKLFELVAAQVASKSIADIEEEQEAKSLLAFQNNVLQLPVEKQIHLFNRLCALANVQMT